MKNYHKVKCQNDLFSPSPVEFLISMFRGMNDVLWLIMVLWHILSRNQPGATLAPLGEIFYTYQNQNGRRENIAPIINTL